MLVIIIILLSLNILLNLGIGFFLLVALGELGTLKKYRFEFGPVLSSAGNDGFDENVSRRAA